TITAVSFSETNDLAGLVFNAGASQYTISTAGHAFTIYGNVVSNSGLVQTISVDAGAGGGFTHGHAGGSDVVYDVSSSLQMRGNTSAGDATFIARSGSIIEFRGASAADTARFVGAG